MKPSTQLRGPFTKNRNLLLIQLPQHIPWKPKPRKRISSIKSRPIFGKEELVRGQKPRNFIVIYAYALKEKLEFVNGLVPEEPPEASGESWGREIDLPDEIGERDNGVFANVLGEGEGQGPGGVEVVSQGFLSFFDDFGFVLGMDPGEVGIWGKPPGCGGGGSGGGREAT
ncbi:hypothetical protein TorRG33x02_257670 [Trema orientale]|uniref:Uncharacterized protein n=1 Tax=Trema orientale TaxID=63057 RepID=A0A2P5DAA8_TREOI|nr:hypothetical protein TorRG33x02_257670 [Trema orientale]